MIATGVGYRFCCFGSVRPRRPTRLKAFDYRGKHSYFITCSTANRRKLFTDSTVVTAAAEQIVRTCAERQFRVLAYVFMEDHLHLLMRGTSENSDFKSTMTLLRQRTAITYRRSRGDQLWQDGYFERVLRHTDDVFEVIRYIRENPANAGLAADRREHPYVWWVTDVNADSDTSSAPL
jgi:putative transposase